MHISKLSLVNYRNFSNAELHFSAGVNTVIGENGAGKSNLFRAIRLLLDQNMLSAAYRLEEGDFHRGLRLWKGHWIVISAEFAEITADESIQALFVHGTGIVQDAPIDRATYNIIFRPSKEIRLKLAALTDGDHAGMNDVLGAVTIDDYETIFTGRSTANFNDEAFYKSVVGDFENAVFNTELAFPEIGVTLPKQLSVSREISFSFVQALRDVVQDFQNNRANPLRVLLRSKSGEIDATAFKVITDKVLDLNQSIEEWPDVEAIRGDIKQTIKDTVGVAYSPSSMTIKSDLPDDADRLFQSLKLFVGEDGETYEGGIHELSLGGANLIYLTLKLLEFKYQKAKQSLANFLLIEEPEAHIHTHIQKTLFDRLNYQDTQIIYSTHSTQISEVSNIQSMNILGRDAGRCEAYQPANGLDEKSVRNVQRYLDAVRSNLLFARSVILVEGDAEEIMIPAMFKNVLGLGLDELGVSLINIRSTGFENIAVLFHDERIRKRCAIVTDLDDSIIATDPVATDKPITAAFKLKSKGSQEAGAARKIRLDGFASANQWIAPFYAPHTFEVDFVGAGNSAEVVAAIEDIYTSAESKTKATADVRAMELVTYGYRVLKLAEKEGKGWFAILLAGKLGAQTAIPPYILDAFKFVNPTIKTEIWFNVLTYRLGILDSEAASAEADRDSYRGALAKYRDGEILFADIVAKTKELFPSDRINDVLEIY